MALELTPPLPTGRPGGPVGSSWRVVGVIGMLGGLCLFASAALLSVDPETNANLPARFVIATVGLSLVWVGLHGLHRAHALAHRRTEAWGFSIAATGLVFSIIGNLMRAFDPIGEGVTGSGFAAFSGALLFRIGILSWAVGVVRAGVLPPLARLAVAEMAGALLLGLLLAPLRIELLSFVLIAGGWLGWTIACGALLGRQLIARMVPTGPPTPLRALAGAFASKATLVTAAVSVGVFSLEWEWQVGLLVVILLYAHEIGHVIAALVRGVTVRRAPFFIPGLGAFVQVEENASHWDSVWVSLGGPLIGGLAALAVKGVGESQGSPALLQAGDIGLWLNVINLAPFSPLDGGRVVGRTGWLGLVTTVGMGILLFTQGVSIFILLLIVFGVWQAFAAVRTLRVPWRTQFGVYAIYLGSIALLLLTTLATGRVPWERAPRPEWLPGLSDVFSFMFWSLVIGSFALPYAFSDTQSARIRYGLLAVLGWTRYVLDGQHWLVPIHVALFAHTLGLPGRRFVERRIALLTAQHDIRAGRAVAWTYDCLQRGFEDADGWLLQQGPALKAGGPSCMSEAYLALHELGYDATARDLLHTTLGPNEFAGDLPPRIALGYAWQLHLEGLNEDALAYLRGVEAGPGESAAPGRLGQLWLLLGYPAEAELPLRRSLELAPGSGNQFILAQALAGQQRFDEATALGENALATWADDPDSKEQARAEVERWRSEVSPASALPAAAPPAP